MHRAPRPVPIATTTAVTVTAVVLSLSALAGCGTSDDPAETTPSAGRTADTPSDTAGATGDATDGATTDTTFVYADSIASICTQRTTDALTSALGGVAGDQYTFTTFTTDGPGCSYDLGATSDASTDLRVEMGPLESPVDGTSPGPWDVPCEYTPSEMRDELRCQWLDHSELRMTFGFYPAENYAGTMPHRLPADLEEALLSSLMTGVMLALNDFEDIDQIAADIIADAAGDGVTEGVTDQGAGVGEAAGWIGPGLDGHAVKDFCRTYFLPAVNEYAAALGYPAKFRFKYILNMVNTHDIDRIDCWVENSDDQEAVLRVEGFPVDGGQIEDLQSLEAFQDAHPDWASELEPTSPRVLLDGLLYSVNTDYTGYSTATQDLLVDTFQRATQ